MRSTLFHHPQAATNFKVMPKSYDIRANQRMGIWHDVGDRGWCEILSTRDTLKPSFRIWRSIFLVKLKMFTTMDQKQHPKRRAPNLEIDTASNTTLYHIYHTGYYKNGYSIHTQSDSNTPLNRFPDTTVGTEIHTESAQPSLFSCRRTKTSPKKICKAKALDNPRCDPRTETSPYFVHLPTLYGKNPPYTLRHGGTKAAPTACLLHCSAFWRTWKLEFGDILAQPGVVDGRGAVSIKYGTTKGSDETFQGYEVRGKRYIGESGKAWHQLQATQNEKDVDLAEKPKPEEVVLLKWTAPLSSRTREYQFTWRGFDFVWKGSHTVQPCKKLYRPFLRYNNLKLVVYIPGYGGEEANELILARYMSVASGRKSGRLYVIKILLHYLTHLFQAYRNC